MIPRNGREDTWTWNLPQGQFRAATMAPRPELVHFAWTIEGLPLRDDAQACESHGKSVCPAASGRESTESLTLELVPLYACVINP